METGRGPKYIFFRLKINSPVQGVTETGVFGARARPTKCFDTHRGSVFSTGKGSATEMGEVTEDFSGWGPHPR